MKYLPFLVFFLFFSLNLSAQELTKQDSLLYSQQVEAGEIALKAQDYPKCLSLYQTAFQLDETSHLDKMRAALCAYQVKEEVLSNKYLEEAFAINWVYAKQVPSYYPEFTFLKDTPFEKNITSKFMEFAKKAGVNVDLMTELSIIKQQDQEHRKPMRKISKEYGWESPQMDSLWALQAYADSSNQHKIEAIITKYGYPGKSLVGTGQASTSFFVIQHAGLAMQEKYLPLLKQAADAGEIRWRSVALLIDRVNVGQGKKQIYGSQYTRDETTGKFYFLPIENPHKIDSIRTTVGLSTFNKYAERANIKWNADAHIAFHKQLAAQVREKIKY